jgi:hypothetical protein
MFWFKPSEVTVDCFTSNPMLYHNYRIDRASKFFPDEIRQMPNHVELKANHNPNSVLTNKIPTIRLCVGLKDLFSHGYILPAWSDIKIEVNETGDVFYTDSVSASAEKLTLQQHDRIQYGSGIYTDRTHVKLLCPWYLTEKSGVKFTWNMCDWHRTDTADDIRILSGILDFKYQHQLNVNAFIRKGSMLSYNTGDPLVHMIPITDKKVNFKYHLVDEEEYRSLNRNTMIETSYSGHRKLKAHDATEKKCPFGFGK